MNRLILASTSLLLSSAYAISLSHPIYINLGGGFGSARNDVTFTTFVPKANAVAPVDRISEVAGNMAYEKKDFTLKPKSGLDFGFVIGNVDVRNGLGIELEFSYQSTKNKEPGLIAKNLNGSQGATSAEANGPEIKFTNFDVFSGIKNMNFGINVLFMPVYEQGFGVYGGGGFGYSQGEVLYKRTADVAYKPAGADAKFGTAVKTVLGPNVTSTGWSFMNKLFAGVRVPFEENSAFDFRISLSSRKTKKITSSLNGYKAETAINTAVYTNMDESNYQVADGTNENYTIVDETPRKIEHLSFIVSASFSPFL